MGEIQEIKNESLTEKDKIRISKSTENYKNGKTITFDELKAKRNKHSLNNDFRFL